MGVNSLRFSSLMFGFTNSFVQILDNGVICSYFFVLSATSPMFHVQRIVSKKYCESDIQLNKLKILDNKQNRRLNPFAMVSTRYKKIHRLRITTTNACPLSVITPGTNTPVLVLVNKSNLFLFGSYQRLVSITPASDYGTYQRDRVGPLFRGRRS